MKLRNYLFIAALVAPLISCHNQPLNKYRLPENAKTVQITLIDSLGVVTLFIPNRYDTSFSWIMQSDCGKPCEEQKYRFQPKVLRITKETGFIWLGEPKDSVDRFTISHARYFPFHDGDTSKDMVRHNHIKASLIVDPENLRIIFDTVQKINDRYFSIFEMEKSDSIESKKILAATTIKGNLIKLQFELLTKKNDSISKNFIKNSIDLIQTIRLSKGM